MDEKLLQMAREAGFEVDCAILEFWRRLARFDELVRADERERMSGVALKAAEAGIDKAMELEREACAKVCETLATDVDRCRELQLTEQAWEEAQDACAEAIRARGNRQ